MNDKNYSTQDELTEELNDPKYNSFLYKWSLGRYSLYGILKNPWLLVEGAFLEIKWAWQRVFRGWDDRVVWSIDYYLAENIPMWLKQLKETNSGVPTTMFKPEDYIDENYNVSKETMERGGNEFNAILDEIILGFNMYIDMADLNIPYNTPKYKEAEKIFEKGFELLQEHFSSLWD